MGRIVVVGYKPKPDKESELAALMKTHLPILREEGFLTDRESIVMQSEDGTIIEVFEWKSKGAIESAHTNLKVQEMWQAYSSVCDYVPLSEVPEISSIFSEFTPLN
jgi:quinol monooxygenase YgiN